MAPAMAGKGGPMRSRILRWSAEAVMILSSGGFLAWYVWAKVAARPWIS